MGNGQENEIKAESALKDYTFLDGLRGWACFAVYLGHTIETYWSCHGRLNDGQIVPTDARDPRILPGFITLPPVRAIWNSHIAVGVFFQLSGFVLPLNYFKKARNNKDAAATDSIVSGMFRRYFRLMIPLLTV